MFLLWLMRPQDGERILEEWLLGRRVLCHLDADHVVFEIEKKSIKMKELEQKDPNGCVVLALEALHPLKRTVVAVDHHLAFIIREGEEGERREKRGERERGENYLR